MNWNMDTADTGWHSSVTQHTSTGLRWRGGQLASRSIKVKFEANVKQMSKSLVQLQVSASDTEKIDFMENILKNATSVVILE